MIEMKEKLPACPVEVTLQLIGTKWKVLIIRELLESTKRFSELQRSIGVARKKYLPPTCEPWRNADL